MLTSTLSPFLLQSYFCTLVCCWLLIAYLWCSSITCIHFSALSSHILFGWLTFLAILQRMFGVSHLNRQSATDDNARLVITHKLASAVYLQVSTISQALIFVTRSRSWSFVERPGLLLVGAFIVAQLVIYLCALYSRIHFLWFLGWILIQLLHLTGRYFDCGICKLGVCCNWRNWLGLGWCHLAVQCHLLYPTWFCQILHPLCSQWKSLGSRHWTKGMHGSKLSLNFNFFFFF